MDAKEALGRLVIARFEQRRTLEAARVRAARWRFVVMLCEVVFFAAVCLYFESTHPAAWTDKLSWSQLAPLLLMLVLAGIVRDYRLQEELHKLRWEIARLREPEPPVADLETLREH